MKRVDGWKDGQLRGMEGPRVQGSVKVPVSVAVSATVRGSAPSLVLRPGGPQAWKSSGLEVLRLLYHIICHHDHIHCFEGSACAGLVHRAMEMH